MFRLNQLVILFACSSIFPIMYSCSYREGEALERIGFFIG